MADIRLTKAQKRYLEEELLVHVIDSSEFETADNDAKLTYLLTMVVKNGDPIEPFLFKTLENWLEHFIENIAQSYSDYASPAQKKMLERLLETVQRAMA